MDAPKNEGAFVAFDAVRGDLVELLRDEVAAAYLTWMLANAQAVYDEAMGVSIEIGGRSFYQKPQRYAAKAFAELKRKRALVEDEALSALLAEAGCEAFLASRDDDDANADESDADETEESSDE
jgi:hypothetical protein